MSTEFFDQQLRAALSRDHYKIGIVRHLWTDLQITDVPRLSGMADQLIAIEHGFQDELAAFAHRWRVQRYFQDDRPCCPDCGSPDCPNAKYAHLVDVLALGSGSALLQYFLKLLGG